jgi:hypothetical protein
LKATFLHPGSRAARHDPTRRLTNTRPWLEEAVDRPNGRAAEAETAMRKRGDGRESVLGFGSPARDMICHQIDRRARFRAASLGPARTGVAIRAEGET